MSETHADRAALIRFTKAEAALASTPERVAHFDAIAALLEADGKRQDDLEQRLRHWTVMNGCERLDGKLPTFLNPWTVLNWMGIDSPETLPAPPVTEVP